jgi:hypothetical protein
MEDLSSTQADKAGRKNKTMSICMFIRISCRGKHVRLVQFGNLAVLQGRHFVAMGLLVEGRTGSRSRAAGPS